MSFDSLSQKTITRKTAKIFVLFAFVFLWLVKTTKLLGCFPEFCPRQASTAEEASNMYVASQNCCPTP